MSTMSQKPTPESAMNAVARQNRFRSGSIAGSSLVFPTTPARLQAIHDLVRSNNYHVPATAIADRMIEEMFVDRRSRTS
jgi:hypothetical protein